MTCLCSICRPYPREVFFRASREPRTAFICRIYTEKKIMFGRLGRKRRNARMIWDRIIYM